MRRILAIDGGGIKGVFPASFLASIEDAIGGNIADYFDLIAGTSTGGIIALGLGMGFSAQEVLDFYEQLGPEVFKGNSLLLGIKHIFLSKYSQNPLKNALKSKFGEKRLGESKKRLVIPSLNLENGEVYIYKTPHHPKLEKDYKEKVVDVALATASAPTFFPPHQSAAGTPLIDGGTWANNPTGLAVVEAIGTLDWPREDLKVLSIGCTSELLSVNRGRRRPFGLGYWGLKIIDVFLNAQSFASMGTAYVLVGHENVIRICPPAERGRYGLDVVKEITSLKGLGNSEARKALPFIRKMFISSPLAEPFEPYHRV